jgi:hypothetical protein
VIPFGQLTDELRFAAGIAGVRVKADELRPASVPDWASVTLPALRDNDQARARGKAATPPAAIIRACQHHDGADTGWHSFGRPYE